MSACFALFERTGKPSGADQHLRGRHLRVPKFLTGGGEMGERIRAHPWSDTPFGAPETWPVPLRSTVSVCLNSAFPTAIYWGPDLRLLYNDAWAPIPAERHPWALGQPGSQVWSDIWHVVGPQFERVLATGEGFSVFDQMLPMKRGGRVQETYWNYSMTPIRDEEGEVVGIVNQGNETTDRVLGLRRQEFKLRLEETLRHQTGARAILASAVENLGRHLGANRVGYGEVQPDDTTVVLDVCWADGVAVLSGSYRLDSFGPEDIARQRQGLPQSCDDVLADPAQDPEVWTAIETRAYASVPLIRNGRFTASLYVNYREPHRWSAEDIALIEDVAARTWEAVERARAEEALRASEERLRLAAHAAQIGTWDFDLVTGAGHWDGAAVRIGGLDEDPGTYDATTWLAMIHPEDREKANAAFIASLDADGPLYDIEVRGTVPAADGGPRWLTSHGATIRDPETGRAVRAVGIIRDVTARHRQQERFRESEARLRTLTNAVPAFVWFATPDGRLQYFNDRWFEYTGQSEAEALPDGWVNALHPDDVGTTAAAWADARARGVTYETEVRYRRRDGAYRWYVARAEPLRSADGSITSWFGTSTDIHEQRQAIERLELALDSGAIQGTWVWDVPADRVTADDRFAHTFGLDPNECRTGFPIAKAVAAIHEDDRDAVRRAIEAALADGGGYRCEYRARNGDGAFRWVEASGRVELGADGTPLRFAGVAVDVEARRAIEAERDRANSLLQAFFETLPGAAYAKDVEGRLLLGNPGFAAAVGHPPDVFLGKTDVEVLSDTPRAIEIMANDRSVMEDGAPRQFEEDLRLSDGRLTQWLSIKSPLKRIDGSVAGIVGISLDMTERRQAEERMRLLAREVDHRAKNLLGVVQSLVQLTRGNDVAGFKAAVSGRIQALARAHSLLAESRWEGVDVETIVREELAPFTRTGAERIRVSGPPVRLRPAASQAFALALHELATNGAKYGALSVENGALEVVWRFPLADGDRRLELVWTERGGPPVTPPSREGFGSTVVRTSVERQLAGEISFDWSPDGLRCRIAVPEDQLGAAPQASDSEPAGPAAEMADVELTGRRVLIVEDEALISLELEQAVAGLGCEVVGPAASPDAALDLIRRRAPDLAILDVNLGGQTSERVARALRALDVPFVFCTGYAEPATRLEPDAETAVIGKPIELEALAGTFRRLLGPPSAQGPRPNVGDPGSTEPAGRHLAAQTMS
jgi:PAS domain S-box-containing protein